MYAIIPQQIPQKKRAEINEKILFSIDSGKDLIPAESVYNIFDESDEITNPTAQRTKYVLCLFRRLKYKILDTGTTTRNHIAEQYSQMELLYNNSVNMICWCKCIYHENRDREIESEMNPYYGQPFPAFRGHVLFKACSVPHLIEGYSGDPYPGKTRYIEKLVRKIPGKVAIGCTSINSASPSTAIFGLCVTIITCLISFILRRFLKIVLKINSLSKLSSG